jgi:hypothetical protein
VSFALRRGGGGSQLSYSYSQSSYSTATTLAPRTVGVRKGVHVIHVRNLFSMSSLGFSMSSASLNT